MCIWISHVCTLVTIYVSSFINRKSSGMSDSQQVESLQSDLQSCWGFFTFIERQKYKKTPCHFHKKTINMNLSSFQMGPSKLSVPQAARQLSETDLTNCDVKQFIQQRVNWSQTEIRRYIFHDFERTQLKVIQVILLWSLSAAFLRVAEVQEANSSFDA